MCPFAAGSVEHVLKGDGGMRASPAKGASPLRSGTSSRVCRQTVPLELAGLTHGCSVQIVLGPHCFQCSGTAYIVCMHGAAADCCMICGCMCRKWAGRLDDALRHHPVKSHRRRRRTRRCWRRWRAAMTRRPSCSSTSPSFTFRHARASAASGARRAHRALQLAHHGRGHSAPNSNSRMRRGRNVRRASAVGAGDTLFERGSWGTRRQHPVPSTRGKLTMLGSHTARRLLARCISAARWQLIALSTMSGRASPTWSRLVAEMELAGNARHGRPAFIGFPRATSC